MGASRFLTVGVGKTPQDAFTRLVQTARHQSGRGGYSGTIAEKSEFILLPLPPGIAALDMTLWVQRYMDPEDRYPEYKALYPASLEREVRDAKKKSYDKYGPAAAYEIKGEELEALKARDIRVGPGERAFVFFGYAAS